MTGPSIASIVTIAAASAAAMVFGGCASSSPRSEPAQSGSSYRRSWSDDDVRKPDWVKDPTANGTRLAAWGSTEHDPWSDSAIMRDRAVASARRELARMVAVKVQAVMQEYVGDSGNDNTIFSQSVGRTIAVQSVRGSAQRDEWIHPKTRELFVLVVVDPAYAQRLARNIAGAARDNAAGDPATTAYFQAKSESDQGFAELDRLLDRTFSEAGR